MNYIGPQLSLPWGFVLFCVIIVAVLMIISMIVWKFMDHFPEDEEAWSDDDNSFVLQNEDDLTK